jgi:TPP-dependent pyruvate/acetoin dehydrogenase alpha subunit
VHRRVRGVRRWSHDGGESRALDGREEKGTTLTLDATTAFPEDAVRIPDDGSGSLGTADLRRLWSRMMEIRLHEEATERLNAEGLIRGSTHLYIGMEAGAVGIVSALSSDDLVIGYYRSHGHALALGVPTNTVLAEILGRVGGCCGGRGGSKHLLDVSHNYLGAYAIVGQQVAMATGVALALKRAVAEGTRAPSLIVCFFGDGAANNGTTLEALNLASVFALPCLFVCENNGYAVSSPANIMVGGGSIVARAQGFGIEGETVDGMDILATRGAGLRARDYVLRNGEPYFLELTTYRYRGHSVFQVEDQYRDRAELEKWKLRDPIIRLGKQLVEAGVSEEELRRQQDEIQATLTEAVEWAKAQPVLANVDEADMFADHAIGLAAWGAKTNA